VLASATIASPVIAPRQRTAPPTLARRGAEGSSVPRSIAPIIPAGTLGDGPQPTLAAGSGLTLRPWTLADAPALASAFGDPAIQYWHHRTLSEEEATEWVRATHQRWSRETDADWAVCRDGEVAGRVALRGMDLGVGQAEVSYWTVPDARGAGVAAIAVGGLAAWAFDEVGFWRLEVRHSTRNLRSCRVATRAGFLGEATLALQQVHDDGWHDVHVHRRLRLDADADGPHPVVEEAPRG
jgi:RimJ/RimL family protein N-acetyltransferase